MAAELAAMSQDETRTSKRDLVSFAASAPTYHAPYDHRMSDRFKPVLSTR